MTIVTSDVRGRGNRGRGWGQRGMGQGQRGQGRGWSQKGQGRGQSRTGNQDQGNHPPPYKSNSAAYNNSSDVTIQ